MKKYLAEFFGTMTLVLFACGVAAVTGCSAKADVAYLATALVFGLVLCALVCAIGSISGCHVNPAVSFAKFLCGKMQAWECLAYVVAQCFGAVAGAGILYLLLGAQSGLGANALFEGSIWKSLLLEMLLSAVFVFVVLSVTERAASPAATGAALGTALTVVHLLGIFFTGTSVNPARSLGPALFVGGAALESVWVFWLAPLLGAFLAGMLYLFFFGKWDLAKKDAKRDAKKTISAPKDFASKSGDASASAKRETKE